MPVSSRRWLGGVAVSEDGRQCVFEATAPGIPTARAAKVKLDAMIVLKCGRQERTAVVRNFSLTQGGKLTAGPLEMELTGVQAGKWGRTRLAVTFTLKDDPARIRRLGFLDARGREIPSRIMAADTLGFEGAHYHQVTYGLHGAPEKVTIRATYFQVIERVSVPVFFFAGIGL